MASLHSHHARPHKRIRQFGGAVLTLCLLAMPSRASGPDNLGGPYQVVRLLVDYLEAAPDLGPAAGTARVSTETGPDRADLHVAFRFKENLSLSDCFASDEAGEQTFVCTWATYPDGALEWTGHLLSLTTEADQAFYRRLGYDFHPQTFTRVPWPETSPREKLEELLAADRLDTTLSAQGMLEIDAHFNADNLHVTAAFDVPKGYKLSLWRTAVSAPDRTQRPPTGCYRAQWKNYGSADQPYYYITEASCESDGKKIHIEITQFDPTLYLSEAEFTPKGLTIPPTANVLDEISGLTYPFGKPNKAIHPLRPPREKQPALSERAWYRKYLLIGLPLVIPAALIMLSIKMKRRSQQRPS